MIQDLTGGLSNQVCEKINKIFAGYQQIEKVILYGSRAKANYQKGSDIDLALCGKEITYELFLPYMIDLSIYHKLKNDELVKHINRVGIVFYQR